MNDGLGDRMKRYESTWRTVMPANSYVIVRVDGRAFHTLLRRAVKPFDRDVATGMQLTAEALCREIAGSVFAYGQSDEISILLTDVASIRSQLWFDGNVQKLASVAASIATMEFNHVTRHDSWERATFDARTFTLPYPVEVANYFLWRQHDAVRNAVSMAAQAHFSHKRLQGVSSDQMQEMLWSQKGINFNDYPAEFKRGYTVTRVEIPGDPPRSRWATNAAPHFRVESGSWLADMIPGHDDWRDEDW
jgi:tRNA(His) 5'-end guanylyltransferase